MIKEKNNSIISLLRCVCTDIFQEWAFQQRRAMIYSKALATQSMVLRSSKCISWELVRTAASQSPSSSTESESAVHETPRWFVCTPNFLNHSCRPVVLRLGYTSESPREIKNYKTLRPHLYLLRLGTDSSRHLWAYGFFWVTKFMVWIDQSAAVKCNLEVCMWHAGRTRKGAGNTGRQSTCDLLRATLDRCSLCSCLWAFCWGRKVPISSHSLWPPSSPGL